MSVREGRVRAPGPRFRHELGDNTVQCTHGLEFTHDHVPATVFREHLDEERLVSAIDKRDINPTNACPETDAVVLGGCYCTSFRQLLRKPTLSAFSPLSAKAGLTLEIVV